MTQKSAPGSKTRKLQEQTPVAHCELVVQYEPLIRRVVSDVLGAHEQRHQSLDDYVQDALMHSLELANKGKMNTIPDSRRLASWISKVITRWAICKLRSNTTAKGGHNRVVGESAIRATGGSGQSGRIGLDLLPVDEQSEEQEVVRELEALVAKMRPELVTIIQAHLSDPDITPKELCAMIGRSKPTLTKLYTTLLNTAVAAGLEPERREQV